MGQKLSFLEEPREIIPQIWATRKAWPPAIYFSVPGAKHYSNCYYSNRPYSFLNLSITGDACPCRCAHCNGKLLQTMTPARTPEEMCRLVDRLGEKGCKGILVSGGADRSGAVPLVPFQWAIKYAKQQGLKVLVHSGLIQEETAVCLKEAGVDQVLIDVIGHESTIREVYHLDRRPIDYLESMITCIKIGIEMAPHVVIGLHFGHVLGEMRALEMIQGMNPQAIVLVIFSPLSYTKMAAIVPPPIESVEMIIAKARNLNPQTFLSLGCMKPPGKYKRRIERTAIDCGANAIAFPDELTVAYAQEKGFKIKFIEECCSSIGEPFQMAQSDLSGKEEVFMVRDPPTE